MEISNIAPFVTSVMERFVEEELEQGVRFKEAFREHLLNSVGVEFHAWWEEVCNTS